MLGIVAFCVHGFFHNEEYLELMFAMVGLNVALQVAVRREFDATRCSIPPECQQTPRSSVPTIGAPDSPLFHPAYLFGRLAKRRRSAGAISSP
jgi:hypothetical protein